MEATIRHYLPSDQPGLFALSADTAFFGEPVEAFLEDRRLYNDAFARYYVEYEASLTWVAEGTQGVLGFLLGCADTPSQARRWRRHIINLVLANAFKGRYRLGRKTASFALSMLAGSLRGENPPVDLAEYPAHLQIDVTKEERGKGTGRRLIAAYLEQLGALNVRGVHLETTSHNEIACHVYEKVGFKLLDERPNRFWTHMLGMRVDNRSYGLKL